jgi:hypothetical protein
MSRKRRTAVVAGALLVFMAGIAAPASAGRATTKLTMNNWGPEQHYQEGHHADFSGFFKPSRPNGAKEYLKRRTSSGWKVMATTTQSTDNTSVSVFYLPVSKVPYAFYVLKVCVHATPSSTAACSPTAHWAFGHYRTFGNTKAASHSSGFSVGPVDYQGHPQADFARWKDTVAHGSAVYDLHGKCHHSTLYGLVGTDVESDPVTFRLYADGVQVGPAATARNNGGTPAVSKNLNGVSSIRLSASAAHPELGKGDYYGFHAKAFCLF